MVYLIRYYVILLATILSVVLADNDACCYETKRVTQNLKAKERLYQRYLADARWPKSVVHYDVDPHLDPVIRHYVAKAIDYFNKKKLTCVRWKQHIPDRWKTTKKHWVTFVQVRDSVRYQHMSATIGWNRGPSKNTLIRMGYSFAKLKLGDLLKKKLRKKPQPDDQRGLYYLSAVLHEMMHVMGFMHEQKRGDRDCWVYVDDAIKDDVDHHVSKHWMSFFSPKFPYDQSSIMHYTTRGKLFYAHDGSPLGRKDGQLSALDIYKVNYVYCSKPSYCDITTQCSDDLMEHRYNPSCFREGPAYNNTPTTCKPCQRPDKAP